MHATRQFLRQSGVDHAVTLDPALPLEGVRYNIDPVMSFPARPAAGMTGMLM
jgi:hypothetical protein